MKKLLFSAAALTLGLSLSAQTVTSSTVKAPRAAAPTQRNCSQMDNEQYLITQDPTRPAQRQAYEQQVQAWIASHQNDISAQAAINIPVVVHVVYQNATENISNNQVYSQIEVLNQDFTATNTDIGSVPAAWTGITANVDVNFCLAQQDPAGNPTTGIDRVSTTDASFGTDNQVKFAAQGGANQWDPTRYFNIWVCDLGGGLLGYGEFPTAAPTNTYGLVVGYYCFGSNFTSYGTFPSLLPAFNRGRTATHEIGHCFNLNHIWGDDGTSCAGTDNVADTPNQADENYGCPTFPNISCTNGPNGDMFMNYMDYVDDVCMYMFTNGQEARMLAVINGPAYGSLQTSTACIPPANAPPIAQFTMSSMAVCIGTPVSFTDQSIFNPTSWSWTFPGATPASSTAQNPTGITWNTAGTYTVTLTATNGNGSDNYTMVVTVIGAAVNPPLTEGFESATFLPPNWTMYDAGGDGVVWTRFNAGRNSSWSAKFDNYNNDVGGLRDEMRTPRMNFSAASTVTLTFDVAHRRYSTVAGEQDSLQVLVSTNCGATWTSVYYTGGATLATVTGVQTTAFTPTNTQWRNETINLNTVAGQGNVLIVFRNRGHYGNNIYVDNVNITTTTSALPNAAFTASATTVCAGTPVTFTDGSSNSPTSWTWTFPSGTPASATTQNATTTWNTAGTYTVTHTATNGSGTGTQTLVITVNARPTVTTTTSSGTICSGNSTTITGNGASTYTWMPGSLTGSPVTVSPTGTTTYTVTGTAANGCTGTATRTITVNTSPTVTATSATTTICSGSSVTLTGNGANTYAWMPGSLTGTNVTVSPTGTTTYTVTGTAANGCTGTATRTITVNTSPTVTTTTSTTTICSGNSATITANGASTYAWMPGSLTGSPVTVSPTGTTTYTVTGTAANGCTGTSTRTITVNTSPTVTATSTTTTICSGSTVNLSATGASTYAWMPGSLTGTPVTVSPTGTTTYTVTGTAANGCTGTATRTITVNTTPTVTTTTSTTTICEGSSATITANGATTYTWMPGSLTGSPVTVSPTTTTTYTVTGSNGGCTGTATRTITVNPAPTLTMTPTAVTICQGGTTSLAGSTTAGCTYSWSPTAGLSAPTAATTNASPAATTTYVLTKTRTTTGCTRTGTVVVTVNPAPTMTLTPSSSTICTGNTVTITAAGASTYAWMPGSLSGSTVTVTPASTTTYTVTGTGANGCTGTQTIAITVGSQPTITASASSPSICTGGSTTLTGNGGTTYTWMPGSLSGSSVTVNPTSTTTYTVTGTNGPGCSNTGTVTVTVNSLPTVNASATSSTICAGSSTTLNASGANMYSWMPGSLSGSSVTTAPASATTYTVTGTDGNGCSNTSTISIAVNALPSVSASASSAAVCAGGSVTLTGNGANTYNWMPGSLNGASVTDVPAASTTYTVTGTDGNGCSNTSTVSVAVNALPSVSASASASAVCAGGSVILTGSGANTYDWMPGSLVGTMVTDAPAASTTYTVTGTDGNGCSNTSTVNVTVNTLPSVSASASSPAICEGGSVTLTGSGATNYDWMPGSLNGATVSDAPLASTTYTVTGTDANGCSNTSTVNVTVNTLPSVSASASANTICAGESVTLTGNGASSYDWMPGSLSGATVTDVPSGPVTYTVTGTDSNGCSNTSTVSVAVNALPAVTIALATDTFCDIDGPTALMGGSPAGGTYSGFGVSGNAFDASSLGAGTYAITYTFIDGNGCTDSASQNVVVDLCLGVSSAENTLQLGAMPNPNNGNFVLTFNAPTSDDYVLEIHNALGQVVYTEQLNGFSGQYRKEISLEQFGTGLYTVRLRSVSGESVIRVITQ